MKAEGKKISILGDSISTFEGYTVHEGLFYERYIQNISGVKNVEQTWWMQVIRGLGAELLVNDSFSGSEVSGNISTSGTSSKRLKNLGAEGTPDIIFIYMGTNDWGYYVMPEDFRKAYQLLLEKVKNLYPNAKICCATLLRGKEPKNKSDLFINVEGCLSPRLYSSVIRDCARESGAYLIDLEKYQVEYDTIDGVHPDIHGMEQIAKLWLNELAVIDL